MAIVKCEECERPIDLDSDEVIWVEAYAYHWQCAISAEVIKEKEDD